MTQDAHRAKRNKFLLGLLPLLIFSGLIGAMGYQLLFGKDPSLIPSALIGDPVPRVELEALKQDKPGFGPQDFGPTPGNDQPILVNVFASWCVPCRAEHPIITALAEEQNIPVYGLNSKDTREAALDWLDELGDPYTRIGYDPMAQNRISAFLRRFRPDRIDGQPDIECQRLAAAYLAANNHQEEPI